jgi:hypothetical protein
VMPEQRRRVPRQEVARSGKYAFEDNPQSAWIECRVLDLSVLGVRIEIFEPDPNVFIGRGITIETEKESTLTGELKAARLVGVIRNVASESNGTTQVGIQFVGDLTWSERALLDSYDRMRLSW